MTMFDEDQLFRVLLRLQINSGMERQFEATWREIGNAISRQPAIRSQWLLRGADEKRSAEEPATYYIISDWTDEQQFRDFEASPEHVEYRKRLHPYRCGVSMTTMRGVCHLAAARAGAS
jgi:heme oxygenase (mycobilin-producing)